MQRINTFLLDYLKKSVSGKLELPFIHFIRDFSHSRFLTHLSEREGHPLPYFTTQISFVRDFAVKFVNDENQVTQKTFHSVIRLIPVLLCAKRD